MQRIKINITGVVQGVGFRPHVYRIAKELQLTGFVFNHAAGVTVEIQGDNVNQFIQLLQSTLPPLASIDFIESKMVAIKKNETQFEIIQSQGKEKIKTKISPDVCVCKECLHELFDPKSRYYHYPFLNCTNCGPRLTIIKDLPYDRCKTTMDVFPFCEACEKDYRDPENRRYHAQPTACHDCGPQLSMSVEEMVKRINRGEILAIKSMGGYQLVCDAKNQETVKKLRNRKHRDAKPFALMALNPESIKSFALLSQPEEQLLTSWERPIVLLKKQGEVLSDEIAKGLSEYGVMLPYTPLHYLLMHGMAGFPEGHEWLSESLENILIVTSANISGNPLIIKDAEAEKELKEIADAVISYNRKILMRVDDSVTRVINEAPYFIRKARGYVPKAIKLSKKLSPGLAVGGLLKNTFCIVRDDDAYVSQYIGDVDNAETIQFFNETLQHLLTVLDVQPEWIAHDLHPNFYTTRFAKGFGVPAFGVQHHHAHLASVIAEHHINEPVLGLSLDGYGYGENGEAWGGELFLLEDNRYQRLGNLKPIYLPGGDTAAEQPWRMASSILHTLGEKEAIKKRFGSEPQCEMLLQILDKKINTPLTSSCGRLFDAASGLLGIQYYSNYEGQAAMRLESLVTVPTVLQNGWRIENGELDLFPLMQQLIQCDPVEGANLFHGTLAQAMVDWLMQFSHDHNISTVVLSGGCFLNKVLTEELMRLAPINHLSLIVPRQLPPNDGGISLGQAWIAGNSI